MSWWIWLIIGLITFLVIIGIIIIIKLKSKERKLSLNNEYTDYAFSIGEIIERNNQRLIN
jgi:protein-S-isoprenylcysteine O-methyltransferase Ste14